MYDQFYGFSGRPFQLTPDARFYFESGTHRKAMSYLGYGLAQGEGFIVITGEIGSGKSTLVAHLMGTIDKGRLNAVQLVSTRVEGDDLLRLVAQQFELPSENVSKAELLQSIEFYLHDQARQGKRSLLIVDEAQNLGEGALEELRMLSNFQLGGHPLLQIFLLGQPEFRAMVQYSPYLEQLRQRVIATHHLTAMEPDEIEPYIVHRLTKVGWKGNPTFTADAYEEIYAYSDGIPRKLNAVVSRLLLLGALEELHGFNGDDVRAVVADMIGEIEDFDDLLDLQVEFEDDDIGQKSLLATKTKSSSGPILANVISKGGYVDPVENEYDEEYLGDPSDVDAFVEPEPATADALSPVEADVAPAQVNGEVDVTGEDVVDVDVADEDLADDDLAEVELVQPTDVSPMVEPEIEVSAIAESIGDVIAEPVETVEESEAIAAVEEPETVASVVEPETGAEIDVADEIETADETEAMEAAEEIEAIAAAEMFEAAPFGDPIPTGHPEITRDLFIQQQDEMDEMARQMAELQSRLADQDVALRKVLTLLVNWVEADEDDDEMASAA